ncbi:hypothetical protein NX02_23435 [Sphingomonas sanxanigenens DSM 19645 = NX02]|uniref:Uncharacterized protein n=2 Tax=Sphingomonas sanxanigenens TaxID=397260 RepID=W0AIB4_9SPHN|nr:hypothetical protein NX02_23435 [Sphingomonas sanxanigenens DSM 19645 = NX02]
MNWHRLTRGEDEVVDAFMAAQADRLNDRLDAANGWHADGRRYTLDPPVPRGLSDTLYAIDTVELQRDRPRRIGAIVQRLLVAVSLIWAAYTCYSVLLQIKSIASALFRA